VTVDRAAAPYLTFTNHKLSREAIIPISQRVLEQIRRQQQDLDERFGQQRPPYLLPALKVNVDGSRPLTWGAMSRACRAGCATATSATPPAGPHASRHISSATRWARG
jgi:integrase